MDTQTRFNLIRGIAQEVVTGDELMQLLQSNPRPLAYDGFEPSGLAHLPVGVYRPILLKQLLAAGVRFKLLLADSFAWINEKMGGDLDRIRTVGSYFVEVWKAAGLPMDDPTKIEIVWHKELFDDPDYWKTVFLVAKNHTEARTKRAMTIAGRREGEIKQAAQLFYPSMQAADVLYLADDHKGVDIAQLGLDQRKANMLAREVAPKLGCRVPVAVHHRMLLGLDGISSASIADEHSRHSASGASTAGAASTTLQGHAQEHGHETLDEQALEYKMSKSKPETCVFVHDSTEEIGRKLGKAFCPAKVVAGNPVLEYAREIVFRSKGELKIERPAKFGGEIVFDKYADLEKEFSEGKLHPIDLKKAVAVEMDALILPIRAHFEEDKNARGLYLKVQGMEVTR